MTAQMAPIVKRLGLSVLVVAIAATTIGVGSFAALNDSESATGAVEAGNVEIRLTTLPGPFPATDTGSITVGINGTCDATLMASGDLCHATGAIYIWNGGNLTFTYTAAPLVVPAVDDACWNVAISGPTQVDGNGAFTVAPGESEAWSFTVELDSNAPNSCQGVTSEVGILFTATET